MKIILSREYLALLNSLELSSSVLGESIAKTDLQSQMNLEEIFDADIAPKLMNSKTNQLYSQSLSSAEIRQHLTSSTSNKRSIISLPALK